jgi:WD40 repeat protein
VAYSPNGQTLAAGTFSGAIHLYDAAAQTLRHKLHGHADYVSSLAWSPTGKVLASASTDQTVRIWSGENLHNKIILEKHTQAVIGVCFSADGQILASRSSDGIVSLWRTADWRHIATIGGKGTGASIVSFGGLAFHPRLPILAALDNDNVIICAWDVDARLLLADDGLTPDSICYTAAKVVLVGDTGVGKTGLGWRLAHGEYKEHDSTHGQQFWVIDELGQTRADGTECEAVLWDLAGQPVYRPIHSIFLAHVYHLGTLNFFKLLILQHIINYAI